MRNWMWFSLVVVLFFLACLAVYGQNRYPVGQPMASSVYTEPFDPCDPAYKFFQVRYGEPNSPRWQAAPDEWIKRFGNNERTMLLQTISELRVVVASLGKKVGELEKWQKAQPVIEPNLPSKLMKFQYSNGNVFTWDTKDPNEVKK